MDGLARSRTRDPVNRGVVPNDSGCVGYYGIMCFSAGVSLGMSAVLIGVGSASMTRNTAPRLRLFAALPLLFGAQQAAEGVVWLTMGDPSSTTIHQLGVIAFLGFAFVIWPVYAPMSLYAAERDPGRRRLLWAITLFGAVGAVSAAFFLARWQPVASIAGHSIKYNNIGGEGTVLNGLLLLAYVVATVTPFIVSSTTMVRTIGGAMVVSLIVTLVVERSALTSVWCFFAALLSAMILVAVAREQPTRLAVVTNQRSPAKP